jgi:4'-phosphopantetheinyl transferase
MSEDERVREQRYFRDADAQRFSMGRGLLRCLLGSYLGTPPEQLTFTYGPFGKPMLAHSLQFNVSHSDALFVVAVAWSNQVGVDIERINRRVDLLELAARFFPAEEHEYLLAIPNAERDRAFYRMWTWKEACVKATGDGLRALSQCGPSIAKNLGRDPVTGRCLPKSSVGSCRMIELSLHPDYCATIAIAPSPLLQESASLA